MTHWTGRILTTLLCCCAAAHASAADVPTTRPAGAPGTRPSGLSVAILDFSAETPGSPELGKQIGETLTALLGGEAGLILVDRTSIERSLRELELNQTGLVDAERAVKLGHLVGAQVLVTGRAFLVGKDLYITAKLIGTETSLVKAALVRGKQDADLGVLLVQLSEEVARRLRENGQGLVAAPVPAVDPLPALRARLAGKKLPKLAIQVTEQHVGATRPAVDPPADTELRMLLTQAGFTVVDAGENANMGKAGVEVVIKGEAVSEFAARVGNLVSCSARLELKAVNYADGKVLFADRVTLRAADLSENIAAKTALQRAGHALGLKVIESIADTVAPVEPQVKKDPPQ